MKKEKVKQTAAESVMALDKKAYGYAVIHNGQLMADSVATSRQNSAIIALHSLSLPYRICENEDCECMVKLLEALRPHSPIVPVVIQVIDHDK